jgi:hypothetical protein
MTTMTDAFGVSNMFRMPVDSTFRGTEVKGVDKLYLI